MKTEKLNIYGVGGTLTNNETLNSYGLFNSQTWISETRLLPDNEKMFVNIRFDDRCSNGHMNFAITADIFKGKRLVRYGCLHDDIKKHFPELAPLIQWHLVSTNIPLHYIANTIYHAKNGQLEFARYSAKWCDATIEQLLNKQLLLDRLPALMADFKKTMLKIGFIWLESEA